MGNKPHRIKKMQQKVLRKASQEVLSENHSLEIEKREILSVLKPFNKNEVKEMLTAFTKNSIHLYLKNKPHHSKRSTPGDVDHEVPRIMNSRTLEEKNLKKWQLAGLQKSSDRARKHSKDTWKKAG